MASPQNFLMASHPDFHSDTLLGYSACIESANLLGTSSIPCFRFVGPKIYPSPLIELQTIHAIITSALAKQNEQRGRDDMASR
jgi:hypothetical protein